jgi:OOP family OmpA-OmpF porin
MKNKIALIALVIIGFTSHAQGLDGNFNQLSLEGAYGMSIPLNYASSPLTNDNFKSVTHFDAGIRYMLNQDWGIKGTLAFDKFTGSDANFGLKSFRMDAQAHYNLGRAMRLVIATRQTVGLFVHSGFGVTLNTSIYKNDFQDETMNYIIGITPLFKITEGIALSTDLSYILNYKQDHYFDGVLMGGKNTTGQMTFSIGAVFYLGTVRIHADWY